MSKRNHQKSLCISDFTTIYKCLHAFGITDTKSIEVKAHNIHQSVPILRQLHEENITSDPEKCTLHCNSLVLGDHVFVPSGVFEDRFNCT